ncbi:clan AA aspartic protease, TIGR02281 family protein [Neorickettsia helminthoeca str. Oregon]|uniref:Clan AA aspartic protease, TIGR02281 family protein n=1 Tax=Neorickettsia helminthoeca str. Oregon TaxID=1286528 RepID=X5H479_9RICK|nr:TIGR02281 family clan AA aspartic protease [Neorickettsia helminthoeca]AHX11371.1 clan AA aspartic protease, TIGR02281 family protein [Neorickettsia helminthoeca str. Oregon]
MQFLYLLVVLGTFVVALLQLSKESRARRISHILFWCAGVCVIAFFYNVQERFFQNQLVEQIRDKFRENAQNTEMVFKKARDGHFYVDLLFNGVRVKCLVDTGASDTILSRKDARRLGINLDALDYTKEYQTANGKINAAPVLFDDVCINRYCIPSLSVSVSVLENSGTSLVGMSFLKHFDFVVRRDTLFLFRKGS